MKGKKSKEKQGKKPAPVLADHKQIGKRFVPPMAQLGLSDVRWVESLLPEFLWLGLLHEQLGYVAGAEVARLVAKVARGIDESLRWCAVMSSFGRIAEPQRAAFKKALEECGALDDLSRALGALHVHYPRHPLAFVIDTDATGDLATIKDVVRTHMNRADTQAMRTQATAMYLAFEAGILKVLEGSALAEFPEVQHYPDTEKSRLVASAVRAGLNGLTIEIGSSEWPHYFWNRGLELEPCTFAGRR